MARALLLHGARPRVAAFVSLGLTEQLRLALHPSGGPDQVAAISASYYRVLKAAALLASQGPAARSCDKLVEQFHACSKDCKDGEEPDEGTILGRREELVAGIIRAARSAGLSLECSGFFHSALQRLSHETVDNSGLDELASLMATTTTACAYALKVISRFTGRLEARTIETGTAGPVVVTHTPGAGYELVTVTWPGEQLNYRVSFSVNPLDTATEVLALVIAEQSSWRRPTEGSSAGDQLQGA